jgi:2-iminoacetate synthase ThiH
MVRYFMEKTRKSYVDELRGWRFPLNKTQVVLGWLDMEITERCNNNCIHCTINLPRNDSKARSNELSTEEIKRILNEASLS